MISQKMGISACLTIHFSASSAMIIKGRVKQEHIYLNLNYYPQKLNEERARIVKEVVNADKKSKEDPESSWGLLIFEENDSLAFDLERY